MSKLKELHVGTRFGRLVVLAPAEPIQKGSHRGSTSTCLCDCGNTCIVLNNALKTHNTQSCGCWNKETFTNKTHGHAGKLTPEYYSWRSMKNRCDSLSNTKYAYYGGKGVSYCKQWSKFENFLADMGARPEGTTLDRFPKPDGNYEPSNCRWGTDEEQYANKRKIIKVTLNGITYTLRQLALAHGMPPTKVHDRWKKR